MATKEQRAEKAAERAAHAEALEARGVRFFAVDADAVAEETAFTNAFDARSARKDGQVVLRLVPEKEAVDGTSNSPAPIAAPAPTATPVINPGATAPVAVEETPVDTGTDAAASA